MPQSYQHGPLGIKDFICATDVPAIVQHNYNEESHAIEATASATTTPTLTATSTSMDPWFHFRAVTKRLAQRFEWHLILVLESVCASASEV